MNKLSVIAVCFAMGFWGCDNSTSNITNQSNDSTYYVIDTSQQIKNIIKKDSMVSDNPQSISIEDNDEYDNES